MCFGWLVRFRLRLRIICFCIVPRDIADHRCRLMSHCLPPVAIAICNATSAHQRSHPEPYRHLQSLIPQHPREFHRSDGQIKIQQTQRDSHGQIYNPTLQLSSIYTTSTYHYHRSSLIPPYPLTPPLFFPTIRFYRRYPFHHPHRCSLCCCFVFC